MLYQVSHTTICRYDSPVTVCHYHARLVPRRLPFQSCPWHELTIDPEPLQRFARQDVFGNTTIYFEIEGSHKELKVVSRSMIEVVPFMARHGRNSPPWENIRDDCNSPRWNVASPAGEFVCDSPLIRATGSMREYVSPSFPKGRPILEGVLDLNHRIFTDFIFDPSATHAATSVEEVWKKKRGVCQDFAQVMIGCLRSIGLPARYVSGYLETQPPPGKEKLIGADASHAWLSAWCGEKMGWLDLDPTNDLMPSSRHITLAWGRDFSDVSPLRGVTLGAGNQKLIVAVDVSAEKS